MEQAEKIQIEDSGEVLDTGRFNNQNDIDKNSGSNLEENVPESSCDENEEEPSNPFEKIDYNEKVYDLPLQMDDRSSNDKSHQNRQTFGSNSKAKSNKDCLVQP